MTRRSDTKHRLALLTGALILSLSTALAPVPAFAAGGGGGGGGNAGGGSGGGAGGGAAGGGGNAGAGGNAGNGEGGRSGDASTLMATCPRGQMYSQRSRRCVQVRSEIFTDDAVLDYAFALAKAERFDEALDTLSLVQNPETPKALNYRGYITRKLGRTDEGIGYYLRSVALDPQYAQVREYLGEAYVTQGKLDLANEQLQVIQTLCGKECEEYEDLAAAIGSAAK
ncbi:tetratricopeptide repeat protein [Microvirga puerhi]|uniref:Tetratricopeptide repeat protein n=1 Tax=Microvirga puerhi TaxID=2876078 RepID=A0ABS7VPM4_9HYPH|nr:tetratricopeptide repeat protein [Microvirga puerhi]MBZ6076957.1 tetratricopeptide repeat protein [Microvirga puerhi]